MNTIDYSPAQAMTFVVDPGAYTRRDSPVGVPVDFTETLRWADQRGTFDPTSLRLVELNAAGDVQDQVPVQFAPGEVHDDSKNPTGHVVWIMTGLTPAYTKRTYRLFFSVLEDGPKSPPSYPTGVEFAGVSDDLTRDTYLEVKVGGELFTIYNYGYRHAHLFKPYFHPLLGPSGRSITQHQQFPGSLKGHYWHRGLFVAHQRVNDISFWEERAHCGRQLHQEFLDLQAGPVYGRFVSRDLWRQPDDIDVLEDRRQVTIYNLPSDRRIIDFQLTLLPLRGPVTLGARPYNILACRIADAMNVSTPVTAYDVRTYREEELLTRSGGMVVDSEGRVNVDRNHTTSGGRAEWIDHSGPNGPEWEGLAMFDNSRNPRHPTHWLNWNNMTMAPSFTWAEPYVIPEGGELTLTYRIYVHADDAHTGRVPEMFSDYAHPPEVTVVPADGVGA